MLDLEISPREVATRLEANPASIVLLDVREHSEYATAKIDGAKHMPMGEIPSRVFEELDLSVHIIAICHSGVRSLKVTVWLRNQGFEKVQSMQGGIDAWSCEVDGKVPRY